MVNNTAPYENKPEDLKICCTKLNGQWNSTNNTCNILSPLGKRNSSSSRRSSPNWGSGRTNNSPDLLTKAIALNKCVGLSRDKCQSTFDCKWSWWYNKCLNV